MGNRHFPYDHSLLLKDAGAVTADGAAQVGGANRILDLGAGRVDGIVVVDVTAIDITTGDEGYHVLAQGSNSSSFASGIVNLGALRLGDSSVTLASADDTVGRYELHVTNDYRNTIYRYFRLFTDVVGTTPSLSYTAFLGWTARY